jgi:hypothetical protein
VCNNSGESSFALVSIGFSLISKANVLKLFTVAAELLVHGMREGCSRATNPQSVSVSDSYQSVKVS